MSVADSIAANYERTLTLYGKWIEVRRIVGANQAVSTISVPARARVKGIPSRGPDVVTTTVNQSKTFAIILFQDLIDGQFPLPVRANDKLLIDGVEQTIMDPDKQTGWVGGKQIFLKVYLKG